MLRKSLAALAMLALSFGAVAQTVTVDRVTRHLGAGTGKVLDTHADGGACRAAVAASAPDGPSMCKEWITKSAEAVALPPVADEPIPAPSAGPAYYFSDCQEGAAPNCVAGNNANSGTSAAAPKRDLAGFSVNTLPAGAALRFARGGAWVNFSQTLYNLNATPSAPLTFDAYTPTWGGTAAPWLKAAAGGAGFRFGVYGDTTADGGYTIRDLKLDGQGVAITGLHLTYEASNVTLENLEITGFDIAVNSQDMGPTGNYALTIRNSNIHRNRGMGYLGNSNGLVIEGNTFANNNHVSGSSFQHAIYLSSRETVPSTNATIRNNTFTDNSVNATSGACTGGNITVHGKVEGLLIEGNTITQQRSQGGCYGIAINPSYNWSEWFRNVVVRNNKIVNLGFVGIGAASAPGLLVEGNVIVNEQGTLQYGVLIPERTPGPGDVADGGAVVRNNTFFFPRPDSFSRPVDMRSGSGATTVAGSLYSTSAADFIEPPTAANGWRCRVAAAAPVAGACSR